MSRKQFLCTVLSVVGAFWTGWLVRGAAPPTPRDPVPPEQWTDVIEVRRDADPPLVLTPHNVNVRGRSTLVGTPPAPGTPVWVVSLNNGEVKIGCTEVTAPSP